MQCLCRTNISKSPKALGVTEVNAFNIWLTNLPGSNLNYQFGDSKLFSLFLLSFRRSFIYICASVVARTTTESPLKSDAGYGDSLQIATISRVPKTKGTFTKEHCPLFVTILGGSKQKKHAWT